MQELTRHLSAGGQESRGPTGVLDLLCVSESRRAAHRPSYQSKPSIVSEFTSKGIKASMAAARPRLGQDTPEVIQMLLVRIVTVARR